MQTTAERFDTATAKRESFEVGEVTLQDSGIWPGLRVEQWDGSGKELPETVLYQHGLMLNLDALRSCEVRWSGHRRVSGDFAAGTLGVFPAGLPYSGSSKGNTRGLVIAMAPEFLQAAISTSAFGAVELKPGSGIVDGFIWQAGHALATDVREGYPCGSMYGERIAVALAAHLVRHHSHTSHIAAERIGAADMKRLRIREFMLDRLPERLSLAQLAAFAQLDLYSFARWFKAAFGMPPHRYLLLARIERAKSLLTTSSATLTDIALQCGFSSHSHLASSFRRLVSVTPSAYRSAVSARARLADRAEMDWS